MEVQLIRNATLRIEYAGQRFIIDPYLAAKHTRPSFTGKSLNPLVDLPCTPREVLDGAKMAVVSHLHSDHFDPAAQQLLPKDMPVFCQPGDESRIAAQGFHQVTPVPDRVVWEGITIQRTHCQHGSGKVLEEMGQASGFIFQAGHEPTVYWAGDTILTDAVLKVIEEKRPKIIITHSCGAVWGDQVLIVMDADQTVAVCRAAPNSVVIAVHMEALDHATITRAGLRQFALDHGISPEQLRIPLDGETLVF